MDVELVENYEKALGASFEDHLTQIYTYDFFQVVLEREIGRSNRYGTDIALAMLDIDSFDVFSERHGMLKANRLLREVAKQIKGGMRQSDLVARYVGSRFLVMMPDTGPAGGLQVLERVQRKIATYMEYEITISIGMAVWPHNTQTKNGMIDAARAALERARARGPNNIYSYDVAKAIEADKNQPLVLLVDDDEQNLKLLAALMVSLEYNVIKAANGLQALDMIATHDVGLVLLDVMMPEMDGFEVCRRLKSKEDTRMIPIVLVTALDDLESRIKGIECGADDFITKPPNLAELRARTKSLINMTILNRNLASIETVLFSLANAVEAKCTYTQGHTTRVSNIAVQLGRKMELGSEEVEALRLGGALHDIGKISISESILNKTEPLSPAEQKIMQTHVDIGYRICLPLEKNLGSALDVVRHHHEKLDGSGYPDGISGDEISKVTRIMAVVDIYDALTTDRPYRKGLGHQKAVELLEQEAHEGKLDLDVVTALMHMAA